MGVRLILLLGCMGLLGLRIWRVWRPSWGRRGMGRGGFGSLVGAWMEGERRVVLPAAD